MILFHIPVILVAALLSLHPPADLSRAPVEGGDAKAPQSATCSFSNVRYSGWCRATENIPEGSNPDEVCQRILNCLNDTGCTKTYCNATDIRGGWRLEKIEAQ
jgi:hypothetical protein